MYMHFVPGIQIIFMVAYHSMISKNERIVVLVELNKILTDYLLPVLIVSSIILIELNHYQCVVHTVDFGP